MKNRAFAKSMTVLCAVVTLGGMTPPEAPVADAAMRGDVEAVRMLLRGGADVNEAQGDGMTALHWAARLGNAELADVLIYAGASLSAGTRIGSYTPLHIATREGRAKVVEVLLDAGADPRSVSTNSGTTPLHLAARSGNVDIVSQLIEHGADIEARESAWGQTPLVFAAALNRVGAIEALLEAGADPNSSATVVDVVEMAAADNAAEQRLAQVLESFKEQQGGGAGWQPTSDQVQAAIDLAREVQTRWPDIPKDDEAEESPEAEAEEAPAAETEAAPEVVAEEHVLDEDAEPHAVDEDEPHGGEEADGDDKAPAEDEAHPEDVAHGNEDEAHPEDATSDEGAQPDTEEADGEKKAKEEPARPLSYAQQVGEWGGLAPIHHAVRQGHVEATLALLKGGADINRPSGDNTTPLLMASINGQWDLAAILLEKGADPTIASTAGATPLYAVIERQWEPRASYSHPTEYQQQRTSHLELMERFLEAGADPDARLNRHLWYMEYTFGVLRGSGINLKGATPFWRAAYALDLEAMQMLAAWGADPDIRTMKPPQRRRGQQAAMEEEEEEPGQEPSPDEAEAPEGEGGDEFEAVPSEEGVSTEAEAAHQEAAHQEAAHQEAAHQEADHDEAAGEEATEDEASEPEAAEEEQSEEDDDKSGLPPIPNDGPAIHALHAASGVGYGQSFAGNAHRYVPNGWMPAVRFLVEEMGADVNARDANGYTALHHAASRGDVEMILYLVEHGADVMVISRKGETVADMANGPVQRVRPYPEAVALLEELGSENNHKCVSCE